MLHHKGELPSLYRGSEKEKIIIGGVRKIFTHEKGEMADKRRAQHQRYKGRNDGGERWAQRQQEVSLAHASSFN